MRITSLGYSPVNQSGQNYKNNNTIQYNTPAFKGKIVITNAEGSVLEHLIEAAQRLLRHMNEMAASHAKMNYSLMCEGKTIEFDAVTPFKIIREGNVLTFPAWPNPTQYMYTHPGYDAVAKETAETLNKALLADAKEKGLDLTKVPQLEFTPSDEHPVIVSSVQDVIDYAQATGQRIIVGGKPIG